MPMKRSVLPGLVLAVVAGVACHLGGLDPDVCWTAAVTVLCATWWVFEPISIAATSLVPFAVLPLVGVLDAKKVASAYGHPLILLLLGGFLLSLAMERSGAHRRLAVGMLRLVGTGSDRRVVGGFMLATAALSMWISNTATVLMMLPIAMALLDGDEGGRQRPLALPLLLGLAWAASIGGFGTPVGTPPNIIFMGVYKEVVGREIGFLEWMRIGVPAVLLMLPLAWWVLTRRLTSKTPLALPKPGPWRPAELRVLLVFLVVALLWVLRTAPYGGWAGLTGIEGADDGTVALLGACALFLLPNGAGGRLLDWETANRLPWGLLILFGGGIAIAAAFESSGLSVTLGAFLADDLGIASWPPFLMMLGVCLVVTFLTEVTSNTATTTLLMPVLAAAGVGAGIDPALLMIPATLAASCAFMLPVATAPNAIVYGTGLVSTEQMARHGLWLNLVGALALALLCWALL
jgi:solute carrier family 13 (sodium-dependent dicarboxylate transporter), member 2/3/5